MFHRAIPHMRTSPTALEMSEARFRRFLQQFQVYERKLTFERTIDAFLDLYSSWKKTHERALKLRLVMLAFELHRLNRQFQCELFFHDEPHAPSLKGTLLVLQPAKSVQQGAAAPRRPMSP